MVEGMRYVKGRIFDKEIGAELKVLSNKRDL